jgi:hypothetical protein
VPAPIRVPTQRAHRPVRRPSGCAAGVDRVDPRQQRRDRRGRSPCRAGPSRRPRVPPRVAVSGCSRARFGRGWSRRPAPGRQPSATRTAGLSAVALVRGGVAVRASRPRPPSPHRAAFAQVASAVMHRAGPPTLTNPAQMPLLDDRRAGGPAGCCGW